MVKMLRCQRKEWRDTEYGDLGKWMEIANVVKVGDGNRFTQAAEQNDWMSGFTDPSEPIQSIQSKKEMFQKAYEEFQANPGLTIERMQNFYDALEAREIAKAILEKVVEKKECGMSDCLNFIIDKLLELENKNGSQPDAPRAQEDDENQMNLDDSLYNTFYKRLKSLQADFPSAERISERAESQQNASQIKSRAAQVMPDAKKHWRQGNIFDSVVANVKQCINEADEIRNAFHSSQKMSREKSRLIALQAFMRNFQIFFRMVTGEDLDKSRPLKEYFDEMYWVGATRARRLEPIFKEITQLRSTVEAQRQIINALEYRHLCEHMPDVTTGDKGLGHKKKWQTLWERIVEKQLNEMVNGRSGCEHLNKLFSYNVKIWGKGHPGACPPAGTYTNWAEYKRGDDLYGELSNNIHDYTNSWEVHGNNWSRSDRLILNSLRPTTKTADGDIDWDAERMKRT